MPRVLLVFSSLLAVPCACGGGPRDGPARLALAQATIDVGGLEARERREVAVRWSRRGDGPLRVLAVEPDCGCARVEGPSGDLAPGAHGTLRVTLLPRSRPGPFVTRVRIFTAASPPHDVVRLAIRGWSGASVVARPACLALGPRSAGATVERRVEVRWPPAMDARRARVRAALEGCGGTVAVGPPTIRGQAGCTLVVRARLPRVAGNVRAAVVLHADDRELLRVPVTARGVGAPSASAASARGDAARPPPRPPPPR